MDTGVRCWCQLFDVPGVPSFELLFFLLRKQDKVVVAKGNSPRDIVVGLIAFADSSVLSIVLVSLMNLASFQVSRNKYWVAQGKETLS